MISKKIGDFLLRRNHYNNRVLVDGDIIVYRSGFASEHNIHRVYTKRTDELAAEFRYVQGVNEFLKQCEEECYVETERVHDSIKNTLHTVKQTLENIRLSAMANQCDVYMSGKNNFREQVAVTVPYKGTRPDSKPKWFYEIREYMIRSWGAKVVDTIEADDVLGIEAQKDPDRTIIASLDKDLDTVPGWHFNWVHGKFYYINREDAYRNLMKQMITGDTIDNIMGIYGKGEKYANKLLDPVIHPGRMEELVYHEYCQHFNNPEDRFRENKQLLQILTEEPEDYGSYFQT